MKRACFLFLVCMSIFVESVRVSRQGLVQKRSRQGLSYQKPEYADFQRHRSNSQYAPVAYQAPRTRVRPLPPAFFQPQPSAGSSLLSPGLTGQRPASLFESAAPFSGGNPFADALSLGTGRNFGFQNPFANLGFGQNFGLNLGR